MKVLVIYGFHEDEKKFGKYVCDEYIRQYNPNTDILDVRTLHKSAAGHDAKEERQAYQEITDLIMQYRPEILVDIHHSFKLSDQMKEKINSTSKKQKRKIGDLIIGFIDRIDPTTREITKLNQKLKKMIDALDNPIQLYYFNAAVDPILAEYLSQNKDYGLFTNTKERNSNYIIAPSDISINTAVITMEAFLNGNGEKVFKDDYYYQSAQTLINITHRIERYVQKK